MLPALPVHDDIPRGEAGYVSTPERKQENDHRKSPPIVDVTAFDARDLDRTSLRSSWPSAGNGGVPFALCTAPRFWRCVHLQDSWESIAAPAFLGPLSPGPHSEGLARLWVTDPLQACVCAGARRHLVGHTRRRFVLHSIRACVGVVRRLRLPFDCRTLRTPGVWQHAVSSCTG